MVPLLYLQDWGLVASSWERSWQALSIRVETAGEFRCRLWRELACRFTLAKLMTPFNSMEALADQHAFSLPA